MKKYVGLLLVAAMLISMLPVGNVVFAAGNPLLEVSNVEGSPGDQITVEVFFNNSYGFGGIAYDVCYDPTMLRVVSYSLGIGSHICVDSGADTYENKINFQYAGTSNIEGDGVLVSIVFEIIAEQPCTTMIDVIVEPGTTFYYDGRREIDFALENASGSVTVCCPHTNTVEVEGIPADCDESGYTAGVYCNDCQTYISGHELISPTGIHVDSDGLWEYDENHHFHTCDCGATFDTSAHFGGEATCVEVARCEVCGIVYGQVDSTNHGETEIRDAVEATCGTDGYTGDIYCKDCGVKVTAGTVIPATREHIYVTEIERVEADCTTDGYVIMACDCGAEQKNSLPAIGHNYNTIIVAPTCTEEGYTTHTCANCGDSYVDTYTDATGHSHVVTDSKAATCTEDGYITYTCRCGDTYNEVIEATGHDYDSVVTEPNCTEQGYTTHTCRCGDSYVDSYTEPNGHSYVDGECEHCGEADPDAILMGDVNGDGQVNYLDAMLIAQFYVGDIEEDELNLAAADVNGDGIVNYLDAMMVAQFYVGDIDSFPAEDSASCYRSRRNDR